MPKDHFDVHLLPIDQTATNVVRDENEYNAVFTEFMEKYKDVLFHYPDITPIPDSRIDNMIGRKFGEFKVVGFYKTKFKDRKQSTQYWWCKCSCGLYCIRHTRSIKRASSFSKCLWCEKKSSIKWKLEQSYQ